MSIDARPNSEENRLVARLRDRDCGAAEAAGGPLDGVSVLRDPTSS